MHVGVYFMKLMLDYYTCIVGCMKHSFPLGLPEHSKHQKDGMGTLEYCKFYITAAAGINNGLQLSSPCWSSRGAARPYQLQSQNKLWPLPLPPSKLIKTPIRAIPLCCL